jgi:hypothetical protein
MDAAIQSMLSIPLWMSLHYLIQKKKVLYFFIIVAVGHQKSLADGPALRPDGPRSGPSAVVARTVRACVETVRVPSFSRDLLPKTAGLTRKTV